MNKLLLKYISIVGVLYLFSAIQNSFTASSDVYLFIFALVLLAVLLIIRPLLLVILLPINLICAGVFTLLANTLTIMFADFCMPGVSVGGFTSCFLLSIPVYAFNWMINNMMIKSIITKE